MNTLFVNWQHKIVIFILFGLTYSPVLYFGIMKNFNNILLGDGAKSLTFIWTVFILIIVNTIYRIILFYSKNNQFTKFLIKLNIEYGKIYAGLWLTTLIFIIEAAIVNREKLYAGWEQNLLSTATIISITLAVFLLFPALAAICNYYLVKSFRHYL